MGFSIKLVKTFAPEETMYRRKKNQMEFEDFVLPFGGRLEGENRWIKLACLIPWEEFEETYSKNFDSSGIGAPAKPVRLALGALIIKERLGCTDEEAVEQIRENPYLQFFLGYSSYRSQAPFDASMFVHFRKRFDLECLQKINEAIISTQKQSKQKTRDEDSDQDGDGSHKPNSGQLIIDATCAPADITHPTDLKLVNKAREKTEAIIDRIHACDPERGSKPRTYRQKARRDYLKAAKMRRLSARQRRKAIKKQLGYLARNLKSINKLGERVGLSVLKNSLYRDLLVVQTIHQQQRALYLEGKTRVPARIISVGQPHIRPIVRSKARAKSEFGAKISLSLEKGMCYLHRFSFEAYNECEDLIGQVEAYKQRHGVYPESVHADNTYRNSGNIRYCRQRGIRLSGARLRERFSWDLSDHNKQAHQDLVDRVAIEGKIGEAKRRYSLGLVMSKLPSTTITSIAVTIIAMNLNKLLRQASFSLLLFTAKSAYQQAKKLPFASLAKIQPSTLPVFQN